MTVRNNSVTTRQVLRSQESQLSVPNSKRFFLLFGSTVLLLLISVLFWTRFRLPVLRGLPMNFLSREASGMEKSKSKRSWRHSLLSWWKIGKKNKKKKNNHNQSRTSPPVNNAQPCKPSKSSCSSGPMQRTRSRNWATENLDHKVPYLPLHHLNSPNHVNSSGPPLYFVT